MNSIQLACCNLIPEPERLKEFALDHGFSGIDWSFDKEALGLTSGARKDLARAVSILQPLEIRYHCGFPKLDLGDDDPALAKKASGIFEQACTLVHALGGKVMTIHVGLGRDTMDGVSWENTLDSLTALVGFGKERGMRVCLENLAWGWTSRPDIYEKLVRKSGCWSTLDIGHAAVCPSVRSRHFDLEDFVSPHAERVVNAHVYHAEDGDRHLPPVHPSDLEERLRLLRRLPQCTWWVVELRDEASIMTTVRAIRQFLLNERARQ